MTFSETLIITTPRRNILFALIVCGMGLVLGLWVLMQPQSADFMVWSAIGVLALAIALIFGAIQLRSPVSLILTGEGFALTGLIAVSIPWNELNNSWFIPRKWTVMVVAGLRPTPHGD